MYMIRSSRPPQGSSQPHFQAHAHTPSHSAHREPPYSSQPDKYSPKATKATEHYFTAQPSSEQELHRLQYSARGKDYSVTASDGVFSARGLDKGTKVLLDEVPHSAAVAQQREKSSYRPICVDLGCGWGPITFALAYEYPEALVLGVDINERAVALTQSNARQLGLSNAVTMNTDQAIAKLRAAQSENGDECDGYVDLIWSNPPIRIGKEALHELLITWLSLLRPETGEAYWVVQKNLGADSLTSWLNEQGYPSEKIASKKGFRIIRSRRA